MSTTANSIAVTQAELLPSLRIRLEFNDGRQQVVDFGAFLRRSKHPALRAYLDAEKFAAFRIEHGDLVWGDSELCFPIADLYDNKLEHGDIDSIAA